ncbi:MAG: sulfatase-like hydrolase/transferase [Firmicutes bacterium]|nr:sulfatase-like hydrolase/transferase [Bacillota bacterium]
MNVIVFFTDQQRWDTTGVAGNPCGLTPCFDKMALEGTYVPNAFTCQPVCCPARGALQTGKYATTVGTWRNAKVLGRAHKTMADYFNEAGYDTGYIGKWHLGSGRAAVKEEERGGYQYWLGANSLEHTSTAYDTVVYDNDNQPVKLPGYRVDALTDAAIRYIDEHKDHPFFLFVSYLEPHFQNSNDSFPPPDVDFKRAYQYIPPDLASLGGTAWQHLSGYYGMVKRLDAALGRVNDALHSLGLSEDTIVLFTSDHGCHFKTRNKEYKRSCHESSIHIPMALYGGPFISGGSMRQLISLVDVAPTLLDACGIPVPEDMEGHSFLPELHHPENKGEEAVYVQISESQVGRAIRTHRWKYSVEALDADISQDSRADRYTETFLYDLEHDPWELHNLIHSKGHEGVCEVLREKMHRYMQRAGEDAEIIPAAKAQEGKLRAFEGEEYL